MNDVDILLVSNKYDFTTDYVAFELYKLGASYLRINRDEFLTYDISLSIPDEFLCIKINNDSFVIKNSNIKAIYYRAPTFLRHIYSTEQPEKQLYDSQWTSFIRNLIIFDNAYWVNHPVDTYKAENKLLQLKIATKLGFKIPFSIVSNSSKLPNLDDNKKYVIKTLEPGLFKIGRKEGFIYSNVVLGYDLKNSNNIRLLPILIQDYLNPKIDIRATVIGNKIRTVKIFRKEDYIYGDWRKIKKDDLIFAPFNLPNNLKTICIKLVRKLGLNFGAIDLALCNDQYYFLEVNPTGEWAWLVNNAGLDIDKLLSKLLFSGGK
ncbi:MAG: hypothetical protein ACOWWH_14120 [Eubacteriaceae bacterium]